MVPRIRKLVVRNYKSIAKTAVDLAPFTLLVGPNGAGKSNLMDALAFVSESLSGSMNYAFQDRGGIGAVRRRSGGHPTHIGVRLIASLTDACSADYSFEIAARPDEQFRVARERCAVQTTVGETHEFEVQDGVFTKEIPGIRPKVEADRLALYAASGVEEFRPVYDFLTSMRFYSIVPDNLRRLQDPDPGERLNRDGSNAAAVLKRLRSGANGSDRYERVCRLLSKVVEGISKVEYKTVGRQETLQFRHDVVGAKYPWTFDALNMSDGTLRVLGLFLAVYQPGEHSVICIEEPEATVHPAVAELVVQVLMDAAREKQVLVTTHSPDILDYKELDEKQVLVVTMEKNRTLVSPLSPATRDAIRKRLYSPGELLRVGELNPDVLAAKQRAEQIHLFGPPAANEVE